MHLYFTGVPYSEHSSFVELQEFVQVMFIRKKIVQCYAIWALISFCSVPEASEDYSNCECRACSHERPNGIIFSPMATEVHAKLQTLMCLSWTSCSWKYSSHCIIYSLWLLSWWFMSQYQSHKIEEPKFNPSNWPCPKDHQGGVNSSISLFIFTQWWILCISFLPFNNLFTWLWCIHCTILISALFYRHPLFTNMVNMAKWTSHYWSIWPNGIILSEELCLRTDVRCEGVAHNYCYVIKSSSHSIHRKKKLG